MVVVPQQVSSLCDAMLWPTHHTGGRHGDRPGLVHYGKSGGVSPQSGSRHGRCLTAHYCALLTPGVYSTHHADMGAVVMAVVVTY